MRKNTYKKNYLLQLKGFCALVEEKTIDAAAKRLNTVHSNISQQIKALEKDTELELFNRSGKSLILTKDGEDFYHSAKKVLESFEELFTVKAGKLKERNKNLIRIAGHHYALSHLLPPYFKKIIDLNPEVNFELHNTLREEALVLLKKNAVDIVIFAFSKEYYSYDELIVKDFHNCSLTLALFEGHPLTDKNEEDITWGDILRHDYSATSGNRLLFKEIGKLTKASRFLIFNETWEIIVNLVKNKLTIATGDVLYLKAEEGLILKTNKNLLPDWKFAICIKKDAALNEVSKNFIKAILPHFFENNL